MQTFRPTQAKISSCNHHRGNRMADLSSLNITSVLQEQRKFECPEEFSQQAHIKSLEDYERIYKESVEDPEKFWAKIAERPPLVQKVGQGPRMGLPLGQMVRRRPAQSLLQLPRPPRRNLAQKQSRHHLGRRARRSPHPHLSATPSRSPEVRQRAERRSASKKATASPSTWA